MTSNSKTNTRMTRARAYAAVVEAYVRHDFVSGAERRARCNEPYTGCTFASATYLAPVLHKLRRDGVDVDQRAIDSCRDLVPVNKVGISPFVPARLSAKQRNQAIEILRANGLQVDVVVHESTGNYDHMTVSVPVTADEPAAEPVTADEPAAGRRRAPSSHAAALALPVVKLADVVGRAAVVLTSATCADDPIVDADMLRFDGKPVTAQHTLFEGIVRRYLDNDYAVVVADVTECGRGHADWRRVVDDAPAPATRLADGSTLGGSAAAVLAVTDANYARVSAAQQAVLPAVHQLVRAGRTVADNLANVSGDKLAAAARLAGRIDVMVLALDQQADWLGNMAEGTRVDVDADLRRLDNRLRQLAEHARRLAALDGLAQQLLASQLTCDQCGWSGSADQLEKHMHEDLCPECRTVLVNRGSRSVSVVAVPAGDTPLAEPSAVEVIAVHDNGHTSHAVISRRPGRLPAPVVVDVRVPDGVYLQYDQAPAPRLRNLLSAWHRLHHTDPAHRGAGAALLGAALRLIDGSTARHATDWLAARRRLAYGMAGSSPSAQQLQRQRVDTAYGHVRRSVIHAVQLAVLYAPGSLTSTPVQRLGRGAVMAADSIAMPDEPAQIDSCQLYQLHGLPVALLRQVTEPEAAAGWYVHVAQISLDRRLRADLTDDQARAAGGRVVLRLVAPALLDLVQQAPPEVQPDQLLDWLQQALVAHLD